MLRKSRAPQAGADIYLFLTIVSLLEEVAVKVKVTLVWQFVGELSTSRNKHDLNIPAVKKSTKDCETLPKTGSSWVKFKVTK